MLVTDLVIWDSHPLALGATPKQVIIDGVPQLTSPHVNEKPASFQHAPRTPDYDKEAADAVKYEGLPPLGPTRIRSGVVLFTNVSSVWLRSPDSDEVFNALDESPAENGGVVVVDHGRVSCTGAHLDCISTLTMDDYETVDLKAGSLQPGLVTVGSQLGLQDIAMETSTTDGYVYNLLAGDPPAIVGGTGYVPKAVDGLVYGTRDAL